MLPLDRCNLQTHLGVNNLPKVITPQHKGKGKGFPILDTERWDRS